LSNIITVTGVYCRLYCLCDVCAWHYCLCVFVKWPCSYW